MQKWIELEPGAPLPPEVPPWAERYELVKPEGISHDVRRALKAAGATLFAGGGAAALLMGASAGFAHVIAALAMLAGCILFCGGLIGGSPSEEYVPSRDGRYVAVELPETLRDPAEREEARSFERRVNWIAGTVCAAVLISVYAFVYAAGYLTLEVASAVLLPILAAAVPGVVAAGVNAVKRRLKSEAEVSERFLQASDPRNPIPPAAPGAVGPEASLPAPDARAHDEVAGA
ncbi:MAG TPA: hypothetical protein VFS20_13510 [Longimicrobium sp.]|nr:hypothetical protein [Longimicrobium sp.]